MKYFFYSVLVLCITLIIVIGMITGTIEAITSTIEVVSLCVLGGYMVKKVLECFF